MFHILLAAVVGPLSVCAICPFSMMGTPLPGQPVTVPESSVYNAALEELDIAAVFNDLYALMAASQECWPADEFDGRASYGPLFIRLAWHCSGSYRATDGAGGCAGGRMRFEPESAWPDNTNLDKARALLFPIKHKYGDALSWGDLFVFSGTAAIAHMGGPIAGVCAGRIDDADGSKSNDLPFAGDDPTEHGCAVDGDCAAPLGSDTVGLIYVNPAGVQGEPVPAKSAARIREVFGRMDMNDSETVALIGGGHAFGKCHGACPLGPGLGPDVSPYEPWPGMCGVRRVTTSGFEGSWTSTPLQWSNEFFTQLIDDNYTLTDNDGLPQWENENTGHLMLTTDLALIHDDAYYDLVADFADDIGALETAFAAAWQKLTEAGAESGWATNKFCVAGSTLPTEHEADGIACGETKAHEFAAQETVSWRFELGAASDVSFTNCATRFDTKLKVWSEDRREEVSWTLGGCDGDDCGSCGGNGRRMHRNEAFEIKDMAAGAYLVDIAPFGSSRGEYILTVQCSVTQSPTTALPTAPTAPTQTPTTAEPTAPTPEPTVPPSADWVDGELLCGERETFAFARNDEHRFIRFRLGEARDVTVSNCDTTFDTILKMWSHDRRVELSRLLGDCDGDDCHCASNVSGEEQQYNEQFSIAELPAGTYYLEIGSYGGGYYAGDYVLSIGCAEPEVAVASARSIRMNALPASAPVRMSANEPLVASARKRRADTTSTTSWMDVAPVVAPRKKTLPRASFSPDVDPRSVPTWVGIDAEGVYVSLRAVVLAAALLICVALVLIARRRKRVGYAKVQFIGDSEAEEALQVAD